GSYTSIDLVLQIHILSWSSFRKQRILLSLGEFVLFDFCILECLFVLILTCTIPFTVATQSRLLSICMIPRTTLSSTIFVASDSLYRMKLSDTGLYLFSPLSVP